MNRNILAACLAALTFGLPSFPLPAQPAAHAASKGDPGKLFVEGSYAKANELYARARVRSDLPADEARWVFFRTADTQWRSQAATQTADTTKLEQAREWLEQVLRETKPGDEHDRVWAEAQESLGDYFWIRRQSQNWYASLPYYQQALDWWAGAHDTGLARVRYLNMVWRMSRPPGAEPYSHYGYWGNYVPLDVLENALKIAPGENDRAHAHYLIAMTLRSQGGDWEQRARVPDEFEAALAG